MRVLMVWPKFQSHSFWNFESVCEVTGTRYMTPPLGLLTVAALLPEQWQLRLIDENVELVEDADFEWADLVFMGSKIVSRERALGLIDRAKALGKVVVAGGPDVTLFEELYAEVGADWICSGEAELTIPRLLTAMNEGEEGGTIRAGGMADITKTPPPRFDLLNLSDYLYIGLQYSRGCPYNCEFCNVIDIFDGYRIKNKEQVIRELDALYASGYRGQVDFFDDNFVGNMKQAKEMLLALAEWLEAHNHPFTFSTSVTLNVAKDDEMLRLLRRARFKYFLIGIETPSKEALMAAQKSQNTGFSIAEAVDRIYRIAGATVHSGFLIGMDGEPDDIADMVIKCIDDTTIPWVMGSIVYPLPKTQLSKRLEREGRLFPAARNGLPKTATGDEIRDQISAGVQFATERPPLTVLGDLLRIIEHSYSPKRYFKRCAEVACRLDTVPTLVPGWRIFFRNVRSFMRMCLIATRDSKMRGPYWRAILRVATTNPVGVESLVTLAVLYTHFRKMLPYCVEMLEAQMEAIRTQGAEEWLAANLAEPEMAIPLPISNSAPEQTDTLLA